MNKITTEIRYKEMSFESHGERSGIRLCINKDSNYCIIVDKDDNVLFEVAVDCAQNMGFICETIVNQKP